MPAGDGDAANRLRAAAKAFRPGEEFLLGHDALRFQLAIEGTRVVERAGNRVLETKSSGGISYQGGSIGWDHGLGLVAVLDQADFAIAVVDR